MGNGLIQNELIDKWSQVDLKVWTENFALLFILFQALLLLYRLSLTFQFRFFPHLPLLSAIPVISRSKRPTFGPVPAAAAGYSHLQIHYST